MFIYLLDNTCFVLAQEDNKGGGGNKPKLTWFDIQPTDGFYPEPNEYFIIQARFEDSIGIDARFGSVTVTIRSPGGNVFKSSGMVLFMGDYNDGIYRIISPDSSSILDFTNDAGTWTVLSLSAVNSAGQISFYSTDALKKDGWPIKFLAGDLLSPELRCLSIGKPSNSNSVVKVVIRITDVLSKLCLKKGCMEIVFSMGDPATEVRLVFFGGENEDGELIDGENNKNVEYTTDVTFTLNMERDFFSPGEEWHVSQIRVKDEVGNSRLYEKSELFETFPNLATYFIIDENGNLKNHQTSPTCDGNLSPVPSAPVNPESDDLETPNNSGSSKFNCNIIVYILFLCVFM